MSAAEPETLERLVARLEAAAERLRAEELAPDEAAALVEECAQSAAQASAELERLARAASHEPDPGSDQLV